MFIALYGGPADGVHFETPGFVHHWRVQAADREEAAIYVIDGERMVLLNRDGARPVWARRFEFAGMSSV